MVRKKGERRRGEGRNGGGEEDASCLICLGDFANIACVFARLSKLVRRVLACVSRSSEGQLSPACCNPN